MNIASAIDYHITKHAEDRGRRPYPCASSAAEFGVIEVNEGKDAILAFHEKNANAPTMPGCPGQVYASMGNYIFSTQALFDVLNGDAKDPDSRHDFGKDILPKLAGNAPIYAYNFLTNRIPGEPDARSCTGEDVGTIDDTTKPTWTCANIKPSPTIASAVQRQLPPIHPPSSPSTRSIAGATPSSSSTYPGGCTFPAASCATPSRMRRPRTPRPSWKAASRYG